MVGAARFLYWRLLKRGTEIYEYQPTKLHSKLIVLDDVVHIGSANFDMRSLYLNLEMMLRVDDPAFAAMMRRFVEGEIPNSKRILPEEHRKSMTLWNRIKWALGYFVVATADYNVARRLNFGKTIFGGEDLRALVLPAPEEVAGRHVRPFIALVDPLEMRRP